MENTSWDEVSSQCSHNKTASGADRSPRRTTDDSASSSQRPVFGSLRSRPSYKFTSNAHKLKNATGFHAANWKRINNINKIRCFYLHFSLNYRSAAGRSNSLTTIAIGWPAPVLRRDWSKRLSITRALNACACSVETTQHRPVHWTQPGWVFYFLHKCGRDTRPTTEFISFW